MYYGTALFEISRKGAEAKNSRPFSAFDGFLDNTKLKQIKTESLFKIRALKPVVLQPDLEVLKHLKLLLHGQPSAQAALLYRFPLKQKIRKAPVKDRGFSFLVRGKGLEPSR